MARAGCSFEACHVRDGVLEAGGFDSGSPINGAGRAGTLIEEVARSIPADGGAPGIEVLRHARGDAGMGCNNRMHS